jgi:murein DD-endopeptidase MepM/ murein hydrolase activator NlpD
MRARIRISFRAFGSIVLVLTSVAGVVVARADTREDLQQAKRRLEELKGTIVAREAALVDLQTRLNDLALKIEVAGFEAEGTRREIIDTRVRIEAGEREYASLRGRLNERAVDVFVGGPATYLDFLLGASSMIDLSDRVEFLDAVQRRDADLSNDVQNTLADLEIARSDLEEMLARQKKTLDGLTQDRIELGSRFAEQQALFDEARSLRDEADALVARLNKKLQAELAPPPPTSADGDGIPGPLFTCPVSGPHAYADTFGDLHVHPGWTHLHQGNDIAAPDGARIVAPFAGTAVSGSDENAGLYVTVTGAEGFAQMLHMSSFGRLGAVKTGDVIGYIGMTGNATGPSTHFEWHPSGGIAVDPYPQLNEVC